MCGIAGKIYFQNNLVTPEAVNAMTTALTHRGPDDGGVYTSPNKKVGLGHRRLAIIDLSPLGHQPMRYLDRYEIVFNGEIYNFQEERELLQKEGYTFQSESDTEVILALYDKYGADCLHHLRGMFAFAIYDEQKDTLFCARDRVGKKPFKYYLDENTFIFASELKAILTQPEYTPEPDYEAIHHYLTLQYVPAPLTGFKDIQKLEPAHYLFIDLKTKKVTKEQYWKLDYSQKSNLSNKEWQKRILETLEESVKLRMIADVPLGAFLSGGVDSSAVVALMAKNSSRPVRTFSIGFKEESHNELPYAKMLAKKYETQHTEFIVEANAIEHLPHLVSQYEEPFADSSALPTYLVAKLTKEHVTVALNGDGGDENFAGYGRYSVLKFSLWYERFFWLHKIIIYPVIKKLIQHAPSAFLIRVERFSHGMLENYSKRYLDYLSYFTDSMKKELYTQDFYEKTKHWDSSKKVSEKFSATGAKNKVEQAVGADFLTYLPDDLLAKVDIATMAVSLEGRSPFLDHKLLELTAKIPFSKKLKGLNNKKYILKKTLEGIVPHEILYRPKMGFGIPIHTWFRNELKEYSEKLLLSPQALARGLFTKKGIQRLLKNHQENKGDYGYQIWALVTLELWFQKYFDK